MPGLRNFAGMEKVVGDADILIGLCTPEIVKRGVKLTWVQLLNAGADSCTTIPAVKERGLPVTNLARIQGPHMAEHALALMLALVRQLPQIDQRLRGGTWKITPDRPMPALHASTFATAGFGRIARTGSVQVTQAFDVERYSHVMHIVSNVEGTLRPEVGQLDVLKATFPAGTLSGAPKVRAMELIDELEPVERGIYGGACGYLSFAGDMDLAIAIRTGIIKDGNLYVQAAAGVVADSDPDAEWRETEHKARAVLRAAEQVQDGLDADF